MAKKAHRIGPYSRALPLACIDGRTREGKFARAVQDELTQHVGGAPTAAEQILIKLASIKVLRVALMTRHELSEHSISERNDREFLCWSNSLRRDLDVLGITKRATQSPSLKEYTAARYGGAAA